MPQPILHLHLAERAWTELADQGRFVTVEERNAFLQGSLGPDLGFFPGSSPQLSRPVHHYRTADMLRALLANAQSEIERAYAWGWATHFLADALLHPIIDSWCADPKNHLPDCSDPLRLHVRLELGLDIQHIRSVESRRFFPFRRCFNKESIEFVRCAYQQTYNVQHEARTLLAATRNAAHLAFRLHTLQTVLAYDLSRRTVALGPHRLLIKSLQGITALAGRRETVIGAFLSPISPPRHLLAAIDEALDQFLPWFAHSYQSELALLPNLDLDTGLTIPDDFEYAVA